MENRIRMMYLIVCRNYIVSRGGHSMKDVICIITDILNEVDKKKINSEEFKDGFATCLKIICEAFELNE